MIQTEDSSRLYAGNNSTSVPYPVPFMFFQDEDLVVVVRDVAGVEELQVLHTDYTVLGAGDPNGGSLTTLWAVPATSSVSIARNVPATQLTSYEEGDAFPAKSHERALDKLTMLVQQQARGLGSGSGDPDDLGAAFRLTDASGGISAVAKIDDSMLGIDAMGQSILRTASDMLAWLGQVGTVWLDTAARLNTRGAFAGQLGVQIDNMTIYIANSITPGDWFPFLLGTGIISATNGVPHLLTPPAGDLVGTLEAQRLENKTLISPAMQTPTGLTKSDVALDQVNNTSDLAKPISTATGAALGTKQNLDEKGISNGYPSLDGAGKIPTAQLPDSVLGASQYKGTWNASTNTPSITTGSAPGKTGWYYIVSVAGTTTVDGISSWAAGDQIISNGTIWQKIPNVSAVSSVNAKTGTVVLVKADLTLGNVDNTSDAQKNSAAVTLTNHTIDGASNTLNVRLGTSDVSGNLPVARLNSGTGAAGNTWWCGDGSWKQPPGTGDVNGPAGSVDGEIATYSGTTGKIIGRYSGPAGFAKLSATGLPTTVTQIHGPDLNPDVITAQTEKTAAPSASDEFLIVDAASGQLRRIKPSWFAGLSRNSLAGMGIANNVTDSANDIDIAAGECRDDTNSADIVLTAMTKRLDANWVAGTNQGGRDTGAISDGYWHVYAIRNPTTGVCDALFTKTYAVPIMPSGYTQKRRIGSIRRVTTISPFTQLGDFFRWDTMLTMAADQTLTSGQALLISSGAPVGFRTFTKINAQGWCSSGAGHLILHDTGQTAGSNAYTVVTPATNAWSASGESLIMSDVNGQIRAYIPSAAGTVHFYVYCSGYYDDRDKNG